MIELVFPTAATVFLYFVAVPLLTIVSWLGLRWLQRRANHAHEFGTSAVWLLLVAPVLLPSIWFVAAVAHQLDGHHEMVACLAPHDVSIVCIDLILVAVFIVAPLTFRAFRQPRGGQPHGPATPRTHGELSYVTRPCVPGLACTRGLVAPRIEVDEALDASLEPELLRSVLLHEQGHLRGRDPLRKWSARLCLSVNPLARLLRADLARWELGLEVRRDLEAVEAGADRFRLAEALVLVARQRPSLMRNCCGLIELDALDLRVRVLCDEQLPSLDREYSVGLAGVLVMLLVVPHYGELSLLDWLHHGAELSFLAAFGG